jgi:hypothetical protein
VNAFAAIGGVPQALVPDNTPPLRHDNIRGPDTYH